MDENESYQTSDLALVAALCCHGAIIESVDRRAQRAIFHIRSERGINQLVQAFHSRSLNIEPLTYFNALKNAKSRLYEDSIR